MVKNVTLLNQFWMKLKIHAPSNLSMRSHTPSLSMFLLQNPSSGVRLLKLYITFAVRELAKKTGDFLTLSKTDMEVIALTYQLYKEVTGNEPEVKEVKDFSFTCNAFRLRDQHLQTNSSKLKSHQSLRRNPRRT